VSRAACASPAPGAGGGRKLRILRVAQLGLAGARARAYQGDPGLARRPYPEQLAGVLARKLVYGDAFSRALRALGHEAFEVIADLEPLQWTWARENGLRPDPDAWREAILLAQIEALRPEVVCFQDIHALRYELRRDLRKRFPFLKLVVIFRGAPRVTSRLHRELATADLLVASSPVVATRCRAAGLAPSLVYHGFDESVLPILAAEPEPGPPFDLTFAGSSGYGGVHRRRHRTLAALLRATPLRAWLVEGPEAADPAAAGPGPEQALGSIADLRPGSRVALYGAGEAGLRFRRLLARFRPDLEVACFADGSRRGRLDGLEIAPPEELSARSDLDLVLVVSAHWRSIAAELEVRGGPPFRVVPAFLYQSEDWASEESGEFWRSQEPLARRFPERCRPALFGLDLYRLLRRSRVTFNAHGESALGTADNLRLFQATGVGACLLTDAARNLGDLFEPDREVVTWASPEECVEKARYLLAHEEERRAIASAGQRRALREHTALERAREVEALLQRALAGPPRSRPRAPASEPAAWRAELDATLARAREERTCQVGPFAGELGHMLIHVLPFLNFLDAEGIAVHFCGHANQEVFCRDDRGRPTVARYAGLPNYFDRGVPNMNHLMEVTSPEVAALCEAFRSRARASGQPFFDLSDPDFYFEGFWRWWTERGYGLLHDLGRAWNPGGRREDAVGLFTRTKPLGAAQGRGPDFRPEALAALALRFAERVYVVGHPDQSRPLELPGVVNVVTRDNSRILEVLSRCRLILSHNSGAAYVPRLLRIPGIVFHQGDPRSFEWTLQCSDPWSKSPLERAADLEELGERLRAWLGPPR
jgi:hypothetical protein